MYMLSKVFIFLMFVTVVVMVGLNMELHPDHQIGNKEFSTTVNSSCCEGGLKLLYL